MARPNKKIPPAKTHQLPVRFTEEEYEILSKNSKQFNMSRGEYLRHILVHKKVNPPKMIFHNDTEITSELRKLSKIGSNLNQLARFCNEHGLMNDPILWTISSLI